MRALVAKILRVTARKDRAGEAGVNDRDLIDFGNTGTKRNTPHSVRAMYLALKDRYKKIRAGVATLTWATARAKGLVKYSKPRTSKRISHPQKDDRLMRIEKPLNLILQHCPPEQAADGSYNMHPVYVAARRAANAGRGDLVKKMAAQFVPA